MSDPVIIGDPRGNNGGIVEGATFYRMCRPAQTR